MGRLVILGPQRLKPTVGRVLSKLGVDGPIAAVTAGWQEREQEDDELAGDLRQETLNLELHRRGEEILAEDPDLRAALVELRRNRGQAQALYRISLDRALATVRTLDDLPESPLLEEELAEAYEVVRALDARHLERIIHLQTAFRKRWTTQRRPSVKRHRREVDAILVDCEAVAITGGHVGVLADLLSLFGFDERLKKHTVVAWSAGAMALGQRIVLFHDTPPQGFGNAEVWGPGTGLYSRYLVFPHAKTRLRLADPQRVSILARRFLPQVCVPLDEGDEMTIAIGRLKGESTGRRLERDGTIGELAG